MLKLPKQRPDFLISTSQPLRSFADGAFFLMMIDAHTHTCLSYCCPDPEMTPEFYADFLRNSKGKLRKIVIADHGMAIYFPHEIAWKWKYISNPSIFDDWKSRGDEKLARHLENIRTFSDDGLVAGIEIEFMNDGRPVFSPEFRNNVDIIIGSVHFLNIKENASRDEILSQWLENVDMILSFGVDILGHPFRWLESKISTVPTEIIQETVRRAKEKNIALELNSHFKMNSDIPMLREILKYNATISFGTDAHAKEEIGNFSYHNAILNAAGISLSDLTFICI